MLARAASRPCSGAGDVPCRHAPSTRPWGPVGLAHGAARRGQGAVVKLVAARPATLVAAATDGKQIVNGSAVAGISKLVTSTVGKSTNILWHDCPIGQHERQKLMNQKGCVVWITGLSGSGKSTLACALSRELHSRGHLTYVLDGDNLRHGLNRDLSFKAEDRAENIRRVGEVAKLFADAGLICIASLISPYRSDRSACRSLLPNSSFIEVFLNAPLEVCEARDPKGLYKLARAGKIEGFTGIDDPYEAPSDCEIVIQCKVGDCPSPKSMADQVDGSKIKIAISEPYEVGNSQVRFPLGQSVWPLLRRAFSRFKNQISMNNFLLNREGSRSMSSWTTDRIPPSATS